jgi:large subunit ribosomal protein L22
MPAATEVQEYRAVHRYAKITARKARLVADLIRGRSVNEALETLEFAPQRAAVFYKKLVRSAMANAVQDEAVNVNRLVISDCRADDGPMVGGRMRWRPGPQGRALPYKKLTSHLTVKVKEIEEAELAPEPEKVTKKTAKKATKKATKKAGAKKQAAPATEAPEAKDTTDAPKGEEKA